MLVKTFQAPSMAEALRMVKSELGNDAMILSTKKEKAGGVMGLFSSDMYRVTAAVEPARTVPPASIPPVVREPRAREATAREEMEKSMLAPLARELKDLREKVDVLTRRQEKGGHGRSSGTEAAAVDLRESGFNLDKIPSAELEEIKRMLLTTLTKSQEGTARTVQWPAADVVGGSTPHGGLQHGENETSLVRELLANGVSPAVVDRIRRELDTSSPGRADRNSKAHLRETLDRLISFAAPLRFETGIPRVIALVGPTGVGKTTTTAKLAAMSAFNGGKKVAMITMDIFRVGAVEQLKTYSRIMGISLDVVSTPRELEKAVEKHADCDLIVIDTAGRSHKDKEKLNEMKSFLEQKTPIEIYLCLSATTKDRELEEILKRFSIFRIGNVIFTKLDESESCGNMVNLLMNDELPIAYFTTGQRVPEDIEVATPARLADMIVREEGV
ncbi:MAG TPA: flagellar biosynthesis protein FlhF [Desulfuromonadales bacterium]|nr:flagellar biosynthesis protein FlhF [Desulfuromonadales bacterium]